jgi:hypothetical protein
MHQLSHKYHVVSAQHAHDLVAPSYIQHVNRLRHVDLVRLAPKLPVNSSIPKVVVLYRRHSTEG